MSEVSAWLERVGRRLAREPLQVENVSDWQPAAPGGYGFVGDAAVGRQNIAATLENDLTVTVFSALTVSVLLTGLVRRPDGSTQPIGPGGAGFVISVVGDRVPRSVTFPRGSGVEVIGLSVVCVAGVVPVGSVWAIVQQSRSLPTGLQTITSTLVSGPVSTSQALGWPGSPVLASTSSPYSRWFTMTVPAATQPAVQTVPVGARWELQSFVAILTTGANPTPVTYQLLTPGGSATKTIIQDTTNVIAGTAVVYCVAVSMPISVGAASDHRTVPWPAGLAMLAGDIFQAVTNGAVGIQWTVPQMTVLERLDP